MASVGWANIYVGEGDATAGYGSIDDRDSRAVRGSSQADLIFGESGNDQLFGRGYLAG